MSQALIRVKATHDPASMVGQAYLPHVLFFELDISGSGTADLYTFAPGTYVEKVVGRIATALDAGTVDIGDEDTAAKFIANNEWTETTLNQLAVSTQTTAPDGVYYTAAKKLRVTVGGAATAGKVQVLVYLFNLVEMAADPGYHNSVTL